MSTDQRLERTDFHVFSRGPLTHLGTFAGATVTNTDGIAISAAPLSSFPEGAVFAVHDDASVAAFSWGQVREALALGRPCTRTDSPAPTATPGG